MTTQPMYYRGLIGYPPAPAASVQIELIHVDVMTAMQANGWRFRCDHKWLLHKHGAEFSDNEIRFITKHHTVPMPGAIRQRMMLRAVQS